LLGLRFAAMAGIPAHTCKTTQGLKFLRRRLAQIPPAKEWSGQSAFLV